MKRNNVTYARAGHAGGAAVVPVAPPAHDTQRAFLVDQVRRMERKVEGARADLAGAEQALSDARSQLASFAGDADG